MCGIFFSLSKAESIHPAEKTNRLIYSRGPDSRQSHVVRISPERDRDDQVDNPDGCDDDPISSIYLSFTSSVLALRGDYIEVQPLVDSTAQSQSVLCWNGEAWKIADEPVRGNDARVVFQLLLEATRSSGIRNGRRRQRAPLTAIAQVISSISGPFSFVFYDGIGSRIIYGRDYLGRRSLLHGCDERGNFRISSVCDGSPSKHFEEVGTDGIHVIDLTRPIRTTGDSDLDADLYTGFEKDTIFWGTEVNVSALKCPIPLMNKSLPPSNNPPPLQTTSPSVHTLEQLLRRALGRRVENIPELHRRSADGAKVALLFSGGLDCTVLARLTHDFLPADEPIDLLNVAFENPRVSASSSEPTSGKAKKQKDSKQQHMCSSLPAMYMYDNCPDRKTGRSSYHELCTVCPGRGWRFVHINVPYSETLAHREEIKRIMRPHNTEMDLSIACALYFASRGAGEIDDNNNSNDGNGNGNGNDNGDDCTAVPYTTSARVLLSGLGADEIFAGYTRHSTAFSRRGYEGVIDEVELDVGRLGKRNLGRDDRVISHWGREARYPFLDEEFVSWALQRPVWEKCGFRAAAEVEAEQQHDHDDDDGGEGRRLDPEKQALRLVAWNLGMKNVAREKKRAIQFGARTAKMESGKSKGTTIVC